MKAILVAAGEGKRMRPLTLETPKPMIRVLGKPLLHWIIESLPSEITELIIVVGYKGEQIKEYFGNRFEGRSVSYVWQEKPLGTGHALHLCKEFIQPGERFLFMFADDLHSAGAIKRLVQRGVGILAQEYEDPRPFGVLEVDAQDRVIGIEEKPKQPKSNLVAVGVYVFDSTFFKHPMPLSARGEYEYIEPLRAMLREMAVVVERTDFWHPIGQPHQIDSAERILAGTQKLLHPYADTKVIIIAGGRGTRLPAQEQDKPKCLVEVAGKPILAWQLENIRRQGFHRIHLALGYKAEAVIAWLTQSKNMDITYTVEEKPLGTGGALKLAMGEERKPFIALNADDLADVNYESLIRHSLGDKHSVVAGRAIDDVRTFGSLVCDDYKRICDFKEKSPEPQSGVVSIGHYYLTPDVFVGMPEAFSIERDVFPKLAAALKLILCSHAGNYWLTTNTAEQLAEARNYFAKSKK